MRAARSAVPVTSDGCQNVCHTTQANICHRSPAHGDTFRPALLALGPQTAVQPPEPRRDTSAAVLLVTSYFRIYLTQLPHLAAETFMGSLIQPHTSNLAYQEMFQ
jgi:hypothetical protein